jgi:site-specific DNA recombinase
MKRFLALARVSSREQEREGFSLEVQEEALRNYAEREGGQIVKLYRIAETASKNEDRTAFKSLLAYASDHAQELDGILFYKVDRAARNLYDFVELERLEDKHKIPVVFISQPTENTPAGRMMRCQFAAMARFYTEQQSLDVREGMARRVTTGLFVGRAPFGYSNVRRDGRGLIEVNDIAAEKVRRIFEMYAWEQHTLDSIQAELKSEGIEYTQSQPTFTRSKIHGILTDRSYIGEVRYLDTWNSGTHAHIVNLRTFNRVQTLLRRGAQERHHSVYGSGLIACGHCGRPIVVEVKRKNTTAGVREYIYYRCVDYSKKGHPRQRLTEADLDTQVLDLFRSIRIDDQRIRDWFRSVIQAKS